MIKELEGVINDLTEQVKFKQSLLMLAEQAREQQKNANASRLFAQNSVDEDMIGESRMETERPFSPIMYSRRDKTGYGEKEALPKQPDLED